MKKQLNFKIYPNSNLDNKVNECVCSILRWRNTKKFEEFIFLPFFCYIQTANVLYGK